MIDYIKGKIEEISPAHIILEAGNIGYHLNISLVTYSQLSGKNEAKLFVHEAIREDSYNLFGFLTKDERDMFLLLISVSGVGANTARVIQSSFSASELQDAIITGNVSLLKSIKGIGAKTAERIIVDLRDKVAKVEIVNKELDTTDSTAKDEAIAALVMLGFSQIAAQKAVKKIISTNPDLSVEQTVKQALKLL